jgi:predicted TIM-barrel fold metal-dependent hydrolase
MRARGDGAARTLVPDRKEAAGVAVIDAQIHLWAGPGSSPRHGSSPFTVRDALAGMDAAGVDAAVIHPPGWDPGAEEYAARVVAQRPERFARYATVELTGTRGPDRLRRLRATPGVLGLRFLCLAPHERAWPQDGTMEWMFALAEQEGMPVTLCGPTLMPIVARTAERHPHLKLVVDHFGLTGYAPDGGLVQSPDVHSWARYPNVAVKLTGAPDYSTDPYPFPAMARTVRALYDAYGPERLFWGTDITRVNGHGGTRHKASWRQCVTMFTQHMPWLSAQDLGLIMGEAYSAWHGWHPVGPASAPAGPH